MALEVGFLRSAVARRVLLVLLAAAALPLAVFAALAYGTLADRLEANLRGRLQEAAKYAGLRVYDRLVSAQAVLAALAVGGREGLSPEDIPLAARTLFQAVATIDHADGHVDGSTELAGSWRQLVADGAGAAVLKRRTLWWQASPAGNEARVLLGVRDRTRWWIAELTPDFLWGDLRDRDAFVTSCVTDAQGRKLLCPPLVGDDKGSMPTVSWSLFTRADFGTVDWVFTRSASRSQLFFGELPLDQVAWKAAAFSLLLVAGLSLVLVRRTTVPLEQLIDGTRRLARRDWSARVDVSGSDEFSQLARSFNDMAGRVERQVQALHVQSGIDREILSGLDPSRVLAQVMARLQTLAPASQVGLLLAPDGQGRWQRVASRDAPAALVSVDPDLLRRLEPGAATLQGAQARAAARLLGRAETPTAGSPRPDLAVRVYPARAGGRTRAMLMLLGDVDGADVADVADETNDEIEDLCDRLAVMLVATERERELRERAVRDSLTGLVNRAGLIDALDRQLAQRAQVSFVLAFIDLDGFKAVNDSRGHPVGDALLCEVAALLRQLVPAEAVIARPGGDEFVLLLPGDRAAADALAQRVCARLAEPFLLGGQTLRIGASIGLVQCPDDGHERVELMRRADLAMYASKGAGRGRHAWFEQAYDERAAERAWLQAELPGALQRNELCLHFQPRLTARTGRLASVEALVRWPHAVRGMIPPMRFVQLAEETGLVEDLGLWVLNAACRQQRRWRDAGVAVPRVAVNVSALQLTSATFGVEVLAVLQRHGLQPRELEIEITESVFVDDVDAVAARLAPLRAVGVTVALDDFGTGFSSLSSLHRLPVDVLKIDRSFVTDLGQRESADAVARSIVALARALGKHVVAEGVETEAQHQHLLALGCDELQGFLFARPLPAEAVAPWIQAESQAA